MKLDRLRLDGQVALVTGGGRGIGRGVATVFSEAGAAVVVTARSPDEIQDTVEQIRNAGGRAVAVQGDVTKREDNARLVEAALQEFGRIDIVVNNAGGSGGLKPFLELTEDQFIDDFRLNTLSAVTLTQLATPHMLKAGGGSVINISSRAGSFAGRGRVQYGVAKAALEHLTRLLAHELAPKIRVNAISIGTVMTSALQRAYDAGMNRDDLLCGIPLNREGDVDDVGLAALYLCSKGCYANGEILHLDGGLPTNPSNMRPVRAAAAE